MSSGQASTPPRDRFRLGDIWITPGANEIGGARVVAKALEVLVALADAASDVLSAAALLDRVWPNVVVVDNVVHQAIAQLRKALGDDARAPRYIENVPRRGYRLIAEVTRDSAPANTNTLAPLLRPRHNLPAQLTSFIGRERELAEVGDLLAAHRLVTLTGVGGCGKTRLALAVANARLNDFPDGVWLVELAPVLDGVQVEAAVARALGVRETGSESSLRERLLEALADKHPLLVLDNCEHIIDACVQLAEALLSHAPHLHILATGREALGIGGEHPWRIQTLATPDAQYLPPLNELAEIESVRLFVERAQVTQPDFSLRAQNAPAVVQICRQLDGIPLAIELAAARMRALSVEQIAARLGISFTLLTGGSRAALPRQQTLQATLDWSYELLSEPERVLLRRLSVFVNGFTLEAAESVGGSAPLVAAQVFDALSRLVDQSMVQLAGSVGGELRYLLLETVRQYGQARLGEFDEVTEVRDRHRDYFVDRADQLESESIGERSAGVFSRFFAERDNFDQALAWCSDRDPETGLRLAVNLSSFWAWQSPFWDAATGIGEGLRNAHWIEDFLAQTLESMPARVRALRHAGMAARGARDFARSRRHLEQSVALAAANAERGERALALTELAATLKRMREPYNAMRMHAEALTLARASEDERVLGWCLLRGSEMLLFNPERLAGFDQARPLLEESVDLMRSAGDVVGLALALYWLSHGLMYTNGEYHQARALLEEVLSYARALGNPLWIADALAELAVLAEVQGSYADAVRTFDECRSITTGTETPDWGIVRADLGRALWKAGDRARGVQMLRETLVHGRDELRRIQSSLHYMNCLYSLYGLALVAGGEEHHTRAARLYGAARNMRSHLHPLHVVDRTLFEDAMLPTHTAIGEIDFAIACAEGAAMTLDEVVAMALGDE